MKSKASVLETVDDLIRRLRLHGGSFNLQDAEKFADSLGCIRDYYSKNFTEKQERYKDATGFQRRRG